LATTNLDRIELEPNFFVSSLKPFAREKYRSTAGIYHGLSYRVGVRDDGTFRIWSDERVDYSGKSRYGEYKWFPADLQIGHETNWLAVSGNSEKLIALKKDGTLWLWNFHRSYSASYWDQNNQYEAEIQKTVPVRLGTHTDWIAINGSTALAADGSVWHWPLENSSAYYDERDDTRGSRPLLDISHKPQLLGNVFETSPANAQPSAKNVSFSAAEERAILQPNAIPIPVNCPLGALLLSISNVVDGSRVAWYCLSNHSDKGIVVLGDSNSLPCYTLLEYSGVNGDGFIMATNHNLDNFSQCRQTPLLARSAATFSVQIPADVNNASLYINYLIPKDDSNGLLHDIKSAVGWPESSAPKSEAHQNFPLPTPYFPSLKK
jgi:hypothetical protein